MVKKENYSSLYILKALCAFMVVFIHTYKYGTLQTLSQPFVRIAVPCFFMISGYFMISRDGFVSKDKIKKILIKIFKITVWAELLHVVISLLCGYSFETPLLNILLGDPVVYFGTHLWYLVAYLEALIFFLIIPSRYIKYIYYFIPFLVIMNLLSGRYHSLIPENHLPVIHRSFMYTALPCIAAGMFVKMKENHLLSVFSKYKWSITSLVLCLSCAEFLLLYFKLPSFGEFYLFTLPFAMCIFLLCLVYRDFGKNTYFEKIGRDYSLDIYIYHYLIYYGMVAIAESMGYDMPYIVRYIIVSVLALFWAIVLKRIFINKKYILNKG